MIKILKSKKKIILKSILIIGTLLIAIIGLSLCIANGWERGMRNESVKIPENSTKEIHFVNNTNKLVTIIVNFRYSKEELTDQTKVDLLYNKIDTIFNLKNKDTYSLKTPIMLSDSVIGLPSKFIVKITDSVGKTLKEYDKETFLKNIAESENINNHIKEYSLQSWILIIK